MGLGRPSCGQHHGISPALLEQHPHCSDPLQGHPALLSSNSSLPPWQGLPWCSQAHSVAEAGKMDKKMLMGVLPSLQPEGHRVLTPHRGSSEAPRRESQGCS